MLVHALRFVRNGGKIVIYSPRVRSYRVDEIFGGTFHGSPGFPHINEAFLEDER